MIFLKERNFPKPISYIRAGGDISFACLERGFSVISITTQLWVLCRPRLSPIALFLGYIQTWQEFCHTVQQTSMQAGVAKQETEPSAVVGLFTGRTLELRMRVSFQKTGGVHLTLPLSAWLQSPKQTQKSKIMHLPVVLRLPLLMKGLAMYLPSNES